MITLIASLDKNRVIGKDGDMPWHLPADLTRFKKLTMGHPIIMGRKTYDSIGKALPGRKNIVMSKSEQHIEGCIVVNSFKDALDEAYKEDDNIFVIGGAYVFEQALPFANRIDLALVDAEVEGDVLFPEVDIRDWKETVLEKRPADEKNMYDITWVVYERKEALS